MVLKFYSSTSAHYDGLTQGSEGSSALPAGMADVFRESRPCLISPIIHNMIRQISKFSKQIIKEKCNVELKDGIPFVQNSHLKVYVPDVRPGINTFHYLNNQYKRNYLKKFFNSSISRNIFVITPQMNYFKAKEINSVIDSLLDQHVQSVLSKEKLSNFQLFHKARKLMMENHLIKKYMRLIVDFEGNPRIQNCPQIKVFQHFQANFKGVDKRDMLVPLNELTRAVTLFEYNKQGVMVEALGQKLYPQKNIWLPTNQNLYIMFEKLIQKKMPVLVKSKQVLDVGCGSGVLSFILAKKLKKSSITAIDIDENSIRTVKINSQILNLKVQALQLAIADFRQIEGQFNVIISNPPWIPVKSLHKSQVLLGNYDIKSQFIDTLFKIVKEKLTKNGIFFLLYSNLAENLGLLEREAILRKIRQNDLLLRERVQADWHISSSKAYDPLKSIKASSKIQIYDIRKQ